MADITLSVHVMDERVHVGYKMDVPNHMIEAFAPLKTTDIPLFMGSISGEVGEMEAKRIRVLRHDASTTLAIHIANLLIDYMEKHDTHNGYKKDES